MKTSDSSFYYKIIIEYDGSNFQGWQIQPHTIQTIQGQIHHCLKKIGHESFKTLGSGRTDSKVHAKNQYCKLTLDKKWQVESLLKAMNTNLPREIRVTRVYPSTEKWHPIKSAKSKEYKYFFSNSKELNPILLNKVTHFKYDLDWKLMEKGCLEFIGNHDFKNYYNLGTDVSSTIRTIFNCSLMKVDEPDFSPFSGVNGCFTFQGNGFLKQMVRLIVGSLIELGRGKISLEDIRESLNDAGCKKIAICAPPDGLYLNNVSYEDENLLTL